MSSAAVARREVRSIRAERNAPGMTWDDATSMFLLSRKRGVEGAKTQARPSSLKNYTIDLKIFSNFMIDRGLTHYNDVKRADVLAFVDWVQSEKPDDFRRGKWSKASQFKVLRTVRAFFNWVDLCEDCRVENMRGWSMCLPAIPRNPKKPFVPKKDQARKFLSTMNTKTRAGMRDYAAGSLMVDCGVRLGEIRHLMMRHLKLDDKFILVPEEGKTGERVVWISSDVVRILKMWMRRRERFANCDYVFTTDRGLPMNEFTLPQAFRRHRVRTNIKGITPHTFRHYFCTDWVRNGGDIAKLQAMTGHKNLDTLSVYLHLANEEAVGKEQERVSPLKNLNKREEV